MAQVNESAETMAPTWVSLSFRSGLMKIIRFDAAWRSKNTMPKVMPRISTRAFSYVNRPRRGMDAPPEGYCFGWVQFTLWRGDWELPISNAFVRPRQDAAGGGCQPVCRQTTV